MMSLFLRACMLAPLVKALSHQRRDDAGVDGAVSESAFVRRGYHWSGVLGNFVYIDGGQVSYQGDVTVEYRYSTTLLSIDLSQDWTNDSLVLGSISKPSDCPDLIRGGVWIDETENLLYTGFAGDVSANPFPAEDSQPRGLWSFAPSDDGTTGTWSNLNASADSAFVDNYRPFSGSVASGGGTGYWLGGIISTNSTSRTPVSGLLSYNFETKELTNTSASGASTDGFVQKGRMIYSPNFGQDGVVIALGGFDYNTGATYEMSQVDVYDPNDQVWYVQDTTGDAPEGRVEFCLSGAASTNKTFDVFVYAGWDGADTSSNYDEVFILSLPSFHWFKADYDSANPRHALTCEHVGGGQILSIGGLDTLQVANTTNNYIGPFSDPDDFKQGLAIFDMTTLAWADSYTANRTDYTMSQTIQYYYDTNNRDADFASNGLKNVFSIQNFSSTATGGSSSSTSNSTADFSTSSSSSSNTGAIAGGVVGGVVGVALVAALVWFILRRRRSPSRESASLQNLDTPPRDYNDAKHDNQAYQELPQSKRDHPAGTVEANSQQIYEAPGEGARAQEMAAHQTRFYELQ